MPSEDNSNAPGRSSDEKSGTYPAADARQIGRYEIFTEIASGGMAGIYLARQMGPEGFQRPVVVKRILRSLVDREEFVDMFLDEARLGAQINHPNVVQIYEFGRAGDTYFMALEYLFGEPLSRAIRALRKRERRIDPVLAAHIISRAAAGLHHAHEMRSPDGTPMGVVHRDVSPQNLFLTFDGHVKVLDFGIAKSAGRATVTRAGQVKGKFAYMSPEQARGEAVDQRADIWSLGVVLYEMTTGTRLYDGPLEVELLYRLLETEPIPPSDVVDDYPPELEAIVLRALQKDRNQRFPTARDLKRALDQYVASQGKAIGADEVADLMGELFADARKHKEKLLEGLAAGGEPIESAFERSTETSLQLPSARDVAKARSQPPPPKRAVPLPMLVLILVGAIVGAGAFALLTEDETDTESADDTVTTPSPVEPSVDEGGGEEPSEAPAPTADSTCRVESDPPGASVWAGGERLCEATPCEVASCDGELELRHEGYARAVVHPVDGRALATLEPIPRPGRGHPRTMRRAQMHATTTSTAETSTATTMMAPEEAPPVMTTSTSMRRGPRPQDLPPL